MTLQGVAGGEGCVDSRRRGRGKGSNGVCFIMGREEPRSSLLPHQARFPDRCNPPSSARQGGVPPTPPPPPPSPPSLGAGLAQRGFSLRDTTRSPAETIGHGDSPSYRRPAHTSGPWRVSCLKAKAACSCVTHTVVGCLLRGSALIAGRVCEGRPCW